MSPDKSSYDKPTSTELRETEKVKMEWINLKKFQGGEEQIQSIKKYLEQGYGGELPGDMKVQPEILMISGDKAHDVGTALANMLSDSHVSILMQEKQMTACGFHSIGSELENGSKTSMVVYSAANRAPGSELLKKTIRRVNSNLGLVGLKIVLPPIT